MGLILSIELCQILNILHRFQGISKGLSMQTTNDLENLSNATYTLCYMVLFTEKSRIFLPPRRVTYLGFIWSVIQSMKTANTNHNCNYV